MIYRMFSIPLILRLLIFTILGIALGFSIAIKELTLCITASILIIISCTELVHYFNSISRKITFFFDAVRNEDSTLHFPEDTKDGAFNSLNSSLNRLNELITDIKIRNENNELFFRQLLKYSSTGIIVLDESGYIDLINDASLDMLQLSNIAHIDLLKQKNLLAFENIQRMKPGQSNLIKMFDGSSLRLISIKMGIVKFGDKSYKVFSLYDIKNELEEKELDTWQKLIRVLTHEIMNSVAPITSLSNTLRRIFIPNDKPISVKDIQQKNIDKALEGLTVIEETGKGLMNFVDNYRKLTKIPKPVFKPIVLDEWLGRIQLLLKDKLEVEKIEFSVINNNIRKPFHGDEKLLTQVIINIINNAIDALGGKRLKKIQLSASYKRNNAMEIKITDNGKGIDEEDMEKIFIPFYTTRENGSGIGLSLSRQIMRLHKGTIEAFSKPGEFTTFVLKL
jgi:two-component system, NtrC family, nitrogen regulation sensor histidine kinase NtrY